MVTNRINKTLRLRSTPKLPRVIFSISSNYSELLPEALMNWQSMMQVKCMLKSLPISTIRCDFDSKTLESLARMQMETIVRRYWTFICMSG